MASTYPNRHYQLGAQNGGQKGNELPPQTEQPPASAGRRSSTGPASAASRSATTSPTCRSPALYGARGLATVRPVAQFYADAAAGTLPQICFVDPPFRDGGGGNGLSADEHPHGDIRLGQAFMSDIVHAFIESPQYRRGAMFVNYDEWGGFFDHVKPPHVPDERANRKDLEEDWSFCGFRVPGVAISPFTRGGGVNHMTVTHESILKLISYRFGLGYLNTRHRYASDIGRSFDFDEPDPSQPSCRTRPRSSRRRARSAGSALRRRRRRPEPHHLSKLETLGLLDRLGYEVQPATIERIFRDPDSVRRALDRLPGPSRRRGLGASRQALAAGSARRERRADISASSAGVGRCGGWTSSSSGASCASSCAAIAPTRASRAPVAGAGRGAAGRARAAVGRRPAGAEVVVDVEEGDRVEHRVDEQRSVGPPQPAITFAWPMSRQSRRPASGRGGQRAQLAGIAESVSGPGNTGARFSIAIEAEPLGELGEAPSEAPRAARRSVDAGPSGSAIAW